jgi:hypothetical protein
MRTGFHNPRRRGIQVTPLFLPVRSDTPWDHVQLRSGHGLSAPLKRRILEPC